MKHVSFAERRLYMHPAHAVVGVSSPSTVFRSMRARDTSAADRSARSLRIRLVSGELDGRSAVRLLQCQRLFQGRLNAECQCSFVDFVEGLSQVGPVVPTDCTVLLYQGITILSADCDWDPELPAGGEAAAWDWQPAEITVVPADVEHRLLRDVGPFASRSGLPPHGRLDGGISLLRGQENGVSRPVAWAKESPDGRVFRTSLGCADDFAQFEFCRILTRAVAWVAGT
jgi:hypothetical protein